MQVLMHTRPDWKEHPGGDFVQLQRWAFWLRRLGVQVEVSDAVEPDLTGVDLVHLNNLGRAYALWPTLQHCRRANVPVLLTTLYWPADEYENYGRPGFSGQVWRQLPTGIRDRIKSTARWLRQPQQPGLWSEIWHGSRSLARRVLGSVDSIIAVSKAEANALAGLLPDHPPVHVVQSGVDAVFWSDDRDLWAREQGVADLHIPEPAPGARSGILCVARFDPQKGQHRLIQSLRSLDVPLVLVGADNPNYPGYRALCCKLAGPNTAIRPRQNLGTLKMLFHACKVHALVSWYELSGLSALEAGACGARVVTTARGGMKEYCGDLAWYADPADLSSIRSAVEAALAAPATPNLANHVSRHFTWEQSARSLLAVYEATLGMRVRLAA